MPRVDKIVGPGNAYVAAAKKQVFGQVGIDMIAGPCVLVIADGTTDLEWAVLDLFSQAEHDVSAQAILLSTDRTFWSKRRPHSPAATADGARTNRRQIFARPRGLNLLRRTDASARSCQSIAAEHLELAVVDPKPWVTVYAMLAQFFLGPYTGETFGDYMAGPSHVLPTFGTARFASPLGVYDFQKRSSIVSISREAARALSAPTDLLARSEGLEAHALAAQVRGKDTQQ